MLGDLVMNLTAFFLICFSLHTALLSHHYYPLVNYQGLSSYEFSLQQKHFFFCGFFSFLRQFLLLYNNTERLIGW
jgi:hypothetical protein